MNDQTTDHLSEAEIADIHGKASLADPFLRPVNRAVVEKVIELAEPFFATYYEDKGREAAEAERKLIIEWRVIEPDSVPISETGASGQEEANRILEERGQGRIQFRRVQLGEWEDLPR